MKSSEFCGWGEWWGLYLWGGKCRQIQGQNDSKKGQDNRHPLFFNSFPLNAGVHLLQRV